jgi:iron(III) transport system ATP-binding protein
MSGLVIDGLHASHGVIPVLVGVDLEVAEGAVACVLGPSGCGKTTLLRIIAGFHRADTGSIVVSGRVLDDANTQVPAERRRTGFVPQDGALFPHLSVAANIVFGVPRRHRAQRLEEMLDLVDLVGLADRHPHQLSGGQRQRVALARALAPAPELLLLDEPFASLDTALRTEVRAEVAAVLRRAGTTAILVTHDQEEALTFADVIAVMSAGRIAQAGTPEDLYHRPVDADVARMLGEANVLRAERRTGVAHTGIGVLELIEPDPGPATGVVVVRPHQLRLRDPGPDSVHARIIRHEFRGHDHRVELASEPGQDLPTRLIAYLDAAPPPTDTTVGIGVRERVHFIADLATESQAIRHDHPSAVF